MPDEGRHFEVCTANFCRKTFRDSSVNKKTQLYPEGGNFEFLSYEFLLCTDTEIAELLPLTKSWVLWKFVTIYYILNYKLILSDV